MDTSFGGAQGSVKQRSISLLASLHVLGRILNWLTSLIRLTAEEAEEAGIDLGGQRQT